ncbi:ATP-binding protein [Nereida sp. MMG025]|uniref:ATP-binding protein n=1 Tax=Nereida sp. MMG025 TaxID=2909981 RepID=UPI001F2CAE0E|nr:ATP-binding protein [Nereida sp. MMG025]MCF6446098.1 ATP-binding protein [Nereida sp. MMG025]
MPEPVANTSRANFNDIETTTLRILNGFAIDLMAIPNVEDLFWYVAQKVVGKLGFVDCVIYQANADQTALTQVAAWGEKNPFGRSIVNPLVIPVGQGITGKVAQNQEPAIIDDLLRDQNYIPDTEPARSEICVPLKIGDRVLGVIDSEHPNIGAFGEAELETLTTVAAMTSAKLALLEEAERSSRRYNDLVVAHSELSAEKVNRKELEIRLSEARHLESIGRLSGQFAHDFNNLLTVISGNLELLEAELSNSDALAFLQDGKNAAARGAKLIQDMLAFSQKARLNPEVCDLNALAEAVCRRNERDLGSTVELHPATELWPVCLDRAAAENAFWNLMTNACDTASVNDRIFISTENVLIERPSSIVLSNELEPGRYVRVGVQDLGTGISDKDLQRIFDPFFTTKPAGSGVGLGLSMVLGFAQQSGGAVSVKSCPGQGSTFHLYFPAAPANAHTSLTNNP